jgi:hypothetical protein
MVPNLQQLEETMKVLKKHVHIENRAQHSPSYSIRAPFLGFEPMNILIVTFYGSCLLFLL